MSLQPGRSYSLHSHSCRNIKSRIVPSHVSVSKVTVLRWVFTWNCTDAADYESLSYSGKLHHVALISQKMIIIIYFTLQLLHDSRVIFDLLDCWQVVIVQLIIVFISGTHMPIGAACKYWLSSFKSGLVKRFM